MVLSVLLLVSALGPAFGRPANTKAPFARLPNLQLDLPVPPPAFSGMRPVDIIVDRKVWASGLPPLGGRAYYHGCGRMMPLEMPTHEASLADPLIVLSEAYRSCRKITVVLLADELRWNVFPACAPGGPSEQVEVRLDFGDEASLRQLFTLLAEAPGEPEEPLYFWTAEPDSASPAGDYLKDTDFVPDLRIEFVGGHPLQVQISLKQRRIMVQAGDFWDAYELDGEAAVALARFLHLGCS